MVIIRLVLLVRLVLKCPPAENGLNQILAGSCVNIEFTISELM